MKYLKMCAFILLYLAVYFILQSYLGGVIAFFYSIKSIIQNPSFIDPDAIIKPVLKGTVIILILSAAASFPIYWGVLKLRKENIFSFCNFSKIAKKNIFLALLLGLSLVIPIDFLVSLLSIDKLSPDTQNMFNIIFQHNNTFMLLLGIGIIGPIIEEIIFRGLILNELKRNMHIVPALIIQALLFGAYHLNLTQGIYAAFLGIILGVVCIWANSIWAPILIHAFYNSLSAVLSKIPGPENSAMNSLIWVVASSIIAVAVFTAIFANKKKTALKIQGND